jgi:hypothetical protein
MMIKKILFIALVSMLLMSTTTAFAGSVTTLNTFSSGTPAVAAEVNENFSAVKDAVDDNDDRINDNATNLASHAEDTIAHHLPPAIETMGGDTSIIITGTDLYTDPTIINSLTVTAPGDGVILTLWSGWIRCSDVDEDEIMLFINGVDTEFFNVEECSGSAADRSVSAHYVFPVTEGITYTYEMRGHDWNNTPNITVHDARMTHLFIPLGFDGDVATAGVSSLPELQQDNSISGGSQ